MTAELEIVEEQQLERNMAAEAREEEYHRNVESEKGAAYDARFRRD